jgi:GNAT superfamily N-acetyltransferase
LRKLTADAEIGRVLKEQLTDGGRVLELEPRAIERVLGFSSYQVQDGKHRTAIYVRGEAARRGVGSALFDAADAEAERHGASEIHVDASLGAVGFYKAKGFEEIACGKHRLRSGALMDCVFMKKVLRTKPSARRKG